MFYLEKRISCAGVYNLGMYTLLFKHSFKTEG